MLRLLLHVTPPSSYAPLLQSADRPLSLSVARLGGLPPNWASFDRLGPENKGRVDKIWAAFKKLKATQSAAFFFAFILVTLS